MKNYNFVKIFKKISRFFKIFIKFYGIFGENLETYLENLEICICRGFEARCPRRKRIYGNLSRNTNGNLQFLDSSTGIFAIFSKFF